MFKKCLFLLVMFILAISCTRTSVASESGFVQFASSGLDRAIAAATKDGLQPKNIFVTIRNSAGSVVLDKAKLELLNFNGHFISKSLALDVADHQVTEFFVTDLHDSVIYAAPLVESELSHLVNQPLPINFTVSTNQVAKLDVEVLSTTGQSAQDFGYVAFGLNIVNSFSFYLATMIYNENNQNWALTDYELTVRANQQQIFSKILPAETNKITLRDDISNYLLIFEKTGYKTIEKSYTKTELLTYQQTPMIVNFEKNGTISSNDLVAYYPFNGDAVDSSSYQNNGVVHGATLTTDRHGNANSAYYFDGVNDYVRVSDHISLRPSNALTVSAWINISSVNSNYERILSKHGEVTDAGGSHGSYQLITGKFENPINPGKCLFTLKTTDGYNYPPHPIDYNINFNEWHLITGTWDGQVMKMYYDGVLVSQTNLSGVVRYDNNPLYIGRDGFYTASYFHGSIDDVRIYKRALSQYEIQTLSTK